MQPGSQVPECLNLQKFLNLHLSFHLRIYGSFYVTLVDYPHSCERRNRLKGETIAIPGYAEETANMESEFKSGSF